MADAPGAAAHKLLGSALTRRGAGPAQGAGHSLGLAPPACWAGTPRLSARTVVRAGAATPPRSGRPGSLIKACGPGNRCWNERRAGWVMSGGPGARDPRK